jgi:hypothetical protein
VKSGTNPSILNIIEKNATGKLAYIIFSFGLLLKKLKVKKLMNQIAIKNKLPRLLNMKISLILLVNSNTLLALTFVMLYSGYVIVIFNYS